MVDIDVNKTLITGLDAINRRPVGVCVFQFKKWSAN